MAPVIPMRKNFEGLPDHLNPTVLGIHKEDAHFEGLSYTSLEDLKNKTETNALCLNGSWKFKLYRNPHEVEDFFQRLDDETSDSWTSIQVPGAWELQGHGTPYYLAKSYPPQVDIHKNKIPLISETDNPTGAYVTSFTLPNAFKGQRIFLRFGAVKSAFQLWVNGLQVGFSKGSMITHEFDVTSMIKEGSNKLAVLVYKYSDGTYLEDQDMWFLGGIVRDVTLVAEPQTYIHDAYASCELIHDYTDANFKLDVTLRGDLHPDLRLKVIISDQTETVLFDKKLDTLQSHYETQVLKPALWSAEAPNLVTIKLILTQGKTLIQAKEFDFGFRSIEIKEARFLINGKPIKFKGVNRHDFDPSLAWGVSKETRLKDLLIMKAHNINAIRTSHYPNPPHLYELADRLGFYVIDEADVETHGIRAFLPKDEPIWTSAVVDRNRRMVLRDRNHPCIVMWSLGNEAGEGSAFMAARQAVKALDPNRPIHYEGDKQKGLSDVYSMMYPTPDEEMKFGEKQDITYRGFMEKATQLFLTRKPLKKEDYRDLPVMNCEYAHCMENSLGNFQEHMDNFEKYDNWIGGFIWDFVDQSIRHVHQDGSIEWLYGGDFAEGKTDAFFCANGLIASDRSLHPAIAEVKQVYANLSISDYDPQDHSVLIKNKNVFIDTSYALFIARILSDGLMIDQQLLEVSPIPAGESRRIALTPFKQPVDGREFILEVDAVEKVDRPWAKQGHLISFGQFILSPRQVKEHIVEESPQIHLHQNSTHLIIQSSAITVIVDKATGNLASLDYGNGNLLKAPLSLNLTRADLDNDCGIELFVPALRHFNAIQRWESALEDKTVSKIETSYSQGAFTIRIHHKLPLVRHLKTTLKVTSDGRITVINKITPKKAMIRFGMTLGLDHTFKHVEFYGRGPWENYRDRKSGSKIGLYQGHLRDFTHDYMRPQENGNHTEVRFLEVSNDREALRFEALTPVLMETSVWPYTQDQLKAAQHIHELPEHTMTTVNVDFGQKGVAGDLPGFYLGPTKYHLKAKQTLEYGFSLTHHVC